MSIIETGRVTFSVLALLLPGMLFIRREEWRRADPVEITAIALACAACYWAVGFWYLSWLSLPLSVFGAASSGAAGVALAARGYRHRAAVRATLAANRRWITLGALFVAAISGLRALLAFTRIAGSVGDMTAHADMTELIIMKNGFPQTHEPLLPIGRFGEVSPGFHVFAALVSLLSGIPAYRSVIVMLCVALAGLTFALYALLRGLDVPRGAAAIGAAGALLLARNPQFFAQWGGAPTLFAAGVALVLLRECLRLHERRGRAFVARAGFLAAGVVLVHVLPAVSALYLAPVLALAALATADAPAGRVARLRSLLAQGLGAFVVAAALSHRFLLAIPHAISPRIEAWSRAWLRTELERALGFQEAILSRAGLGALAEQPGAQTWPFYLAVFLGILPVALLGAGLVAAWIAGRKAREMPRLSHRTDVAEADPSRAPALGRAALVAVALLLAQLVLFVGALSERLPLWPSLYPSRIGLWLIVPLGVAIAQLFLLLARRVRARTLAMLGAAWAALFLVEGARLSSARFGTAYYEQGRGGADAAALASMAANEAAGGAFWVATNCRDNAVLTRDDLAAFDWIRRETGPAAVFATNYGDGGNLIPSTTHRKVLEPHYYFFFYEDEMTAWQESCTVSHIYVSSEASPAWPRRYTSAALATDPRVDEVFRVGAARVFRVNDASVIERP